MITTTEIYGREVKPAVGSYVIPDGWSPWGERLIPGDSFSTFRIPTRSGGPIKSLAIEVEVTGRTPQRKQGDCYVRVKITFPGDGEPDTVCGGWMKLDW